MRALAHTYPWAWGGSEGNFRVSFQFDVYLGLGPRWLDWCNLYPLNRLTSTKTLSSRLPCLLTVAMHPHRDVSSPQLRVHYELELLWP